MSIIPYTFDADKISLELCSFIVKIKLSEASCFERILFGSNQINPDALQFGLTNMRSLSELYCSKILEKGFFP